MEQIAIVVDGTETPAADGSVGFAVASIRQPRRPVAGLAIAVLTAVVTMGALGPRVAQDDRPGSIACQPATNVGAAPRATGAAEAAAEMPAASPMAWWLLPQSATWVDPATGRSMQAQVDRAAGVVHDRRLDR